jgi:hypothetical protein
MKKRILPLLLLLLPYLFGIALVIFDDTGNQTSEWMDWAVFGLAAAVYIANIIFPFVLAKKGESSRTLLFWDMLIKLCYIPIFIIYFISGFIMVLLPAGFVFTILIMVFDYLLLLPSTMYGVSGLKRAYQEGKIRKEIAVLNQVLHFFFCADVISAVLMYCLVRAKDKRSVEQVAAE